MKNNTAELARLANISIFEQNLFSEGIHLIAGIDEAGRGPLAGPVTAAAVILPPNCIIEGIDDSKKLTERKRLHLEQIIKEKALYYAIASVNHQKIDEINILEAARLAMVKAVNRLPIYPEHLLIDAMQLPLDIEQTSLIHGDERSMSIAAASILAKNQRDRIMTIFDRIYPQYGFASHKGYPTKFHRQNINDFGLSPIHRRSFRVKL